MKFQELSNIIKALIVSSKGGLPLNQLENEYESMEGEKLPFLKFGFDRLGDCLHRIKEIQFEKNKSRGTILKVNHEKINHLNNLINDQKPTKTKRSNKRNRSHVQRNAEHSRQDCHQYSPSNSSGYNSSSSFSEENEKPLIFIDSRRNHNYVYEPIYNRRQLIGDDFMLQLAIKELKVPIWRKSEKSRLYTGLCASGQTIRECIKNLDSIDICDKVTILLGAMDVYEGRTLCQMKKDYIQLLEVLENKGIPRNSITICTIPPLGNLSFRTDFEKSSTLQMFNTFLRTFVRNDYDIDYYGHYFAYDLADFDRAFRNDVGGIIYSYFQNDARYVSGTRQPWVLWNRRGRKLALNLI